jgi:CRISPR/Cas system CSM-associated protein Csm2 small subunit
MLKNSQILKQEMESLKASSSSASKKDIKKSVQNKLKVLKKNLDKKIKVEPFFAKRNPPAQKMNSFSESMRMRRTKKSFKNSSRINSSHAPKTDFPSKLNLDL